MYQSDNKTEQNCQEHDWAFDRFEQQSGDVLIIKTRCSNIFCHEIDSIIINKELIDQHFSSFLGRIVEYLDDEDDEVRDDGEINIDYCLYGHLWEIFDLYLDQIDRYQQRIIIETICGVCGRKGEIIQSPKELFNTIFSCSDSTIPLKKWKAKKLTSFLL